MIEGGSVESDVEKEYMIKLVRIDEPSGQGFRITLIEDNDEKLGIVPVESINDNERSYTEIAGHIRSILQSRELILKSLIYGGFNSYDITDSIKACIHNGVGTLKATKYRLSQGEKEFARTLLGKGLTCRQKVRIGDYIVDFNIIVPYSRKILVDVVKDEQNYKQGIRVFQEKSNKLTKYGAYYLCVYEDEVLAQAQKIVRFIWDLAREKKVYPNGLLTLKMINIERSRDLSKVGTDLKIKMKLTRLGGARIVRAYALLRAQPEYIGEFRLPKYSSKFKRFVRGLCNLLDHKYYFSFRIENYRPVYEGLIKFGETEIIVRKIPPEYIKSSWRKREG